jgi:hypothetical protein
MHTDTRIQRPDAPRLARFDATRRDTPRPEYLGRHHTTEDVPTLRIVLPTVVARVAVPLPPRASGVGLRRNQAPSGVSVIAKIRNSIGRRFRP